MYQIAIHTLETLRHKIDNFDDFQLEKDLSFNKSLNHLTIAFI